MRLESTDDDVESSSTDACKIVEPLMKKRISVLDTLIGDDKHEEDVSIQDEVKSYLQERLIKYKKDPLHWWKVNSNRFSHLEPLARSI